MACSKATTMTSFRQDTRQHRPHFPVVISHEGVQPLSSPCPAPVQPLSSPCPGPVQPLSSPCPAPVQPLSRPPEGCGARVQDKDPGGARPLVEDLSLFKAGDVITLQRRARRGTFRNKVHPFRAPSCDHGAP
ncbi:hypothetical protein D4764_14G0002530 [Takifugu flavidus]|uniref:Uncharacterized protein n=1 Tax=Takifugu flavidus TaxID=433684 RepID=A0A5C6P3C0_9TELE|nr:hypothetical protein D4764_14G0002530 [Takifugu flavidus]